MILSLRVWIPIRQLCCTWPSAIALSPESRGTVWGTSISFLHIYISSISVFLTFHFSRTPLVTACVYIFYYFFTLTIIFRQCGHGHNGLIKDLLNLLNHHCVRTKRSTENVHKDKAWKQENALRCGGSPYSSRMPEPYTCRPAAAPHPVSPGWGWALPVIG